jgi:hypothetical protein
MNTLLINQIQKEFNNLTDTFSLLEEIITSNEKLVTMLSTHNLYEIEPYFSEIINKTIQKDAKLLIESEDDYNPDSDDLYHFKIDLETRRTYFKKLDLGVNISYDTIYEYTDDYYKSTTVYRNTEQQKAIKICYLNFKDGMPFEYIECSEYGITQKTYTCENNLIKSYQYEWPNQNHQYFGEFSYDLEYNISQIIEKTSDGQERIIYNAINNEENIATVLARLENFLVENIGDQILEKVKIGEPVYCILFEYSMQNPFPPTLAIGLVSEIEENLKEEELIVHYNAPDMHYFSEDETIDVDFYPLEIQSDYLKTSEISNRIGWNDEDAFDEWNQQVFNLYLKVCKRLMHYDFSKSFQKSDNFLVIARDFEACNEEEFSAALIEYKINSNL